jgi:NADH:ubiquinone oxidoreductase subunit 6 (subunit J)/NADH:ubiquinone oxidoreductase subunit 3 (subunit A)
MTGLEVFTMLTSLKFVLTSLAIISGVFVIGTKNAIISVFNLIVLYILVAFYLIYIGVTFLGIAYIVVYIGAIAILFLFIIMMIDIEVVEKRSNNYLPLLFLLIVGFVVTLKNILYTMGVMKIKSLVNYDKKEVLVKKDKKTLFHINDNYIKDDFLPKLHQNPIFVNSVHKRWQNDNNSHIIRELIGKENGENKLYNNKKAVRLSDIASIKENADHYNSILKENIVDITPLYVDNSYLLIIPNWDSALNRITQISAIGDVLYTVYHSYIYIVSVILLLGMVGAIILTAGNIQYKKLLNVERHKKSGFGLSLSSLKYISHLYYRSKNIYYIKIFNIYMNWDMGKLNNSKYLAVKGILPFFNVIDNEDKHSEGIIGALIYYLISNLILGLLLLFINSSFSLSVKYLEKGGGFECGFTSFVQTRERYNIIFYRVSLLFLIFDLEIILAFPYTAIYQKNENNGKNNLLVFLYILIVGFIYELKEGALNIVKTAHSTHIDIMGLNNIKNNNVFLLK